MTLRDLIDELEDIADEHGDDIDVRLAHQPRWAFEYSISDIGVAELADGPVVYIAEGNQLGYLPHRAAVVLDWAEDREDEDDGEEAAR